MNIRTAERRDLSAMLDIYNYEVKNGTATFDVEPRAGAAGEAWFARAQHRQPSAARGGGGR